MCVPKITVLCKISNKNHGVYGENEARDTTYENLSVKHLKINRNLINDPLHLVNGLELHKCDNKCFTLPWKTPGACLWKWALGGAACGQLWGGESRVSQCGVKVVAPCGWGGS